MSKKATLHGPTAGWWLYSRGDFAADLSDHLTRKQALKLGNAWYREDKRQQVLLKGLVDSERKPPKKAMRRQRYPNFIRLDAETYDRLLALVRWVEDTPACVELPDRTWESIHKTMADLVDFDDTCYPDVFLDSVQIETAETSQNNIAPGTLVALLMCETMTMDDQEFHCVIERGAQVP